MDGKHVSPAKPLIIKKGNIAYIRSNQQNEGSFTGNLFKNLFREDVLYDTTDMYFLKGEFQRLLLVNRFNIITKHSRTVAKYYHKDGSVLEKTSDKVTEVIGQEQFNTLFTALCSILDQQLKIRSILTLLTDKTMIKLEKEDNIPEKGKTADTKKVLVENSCQTDEMRIEPLKPKKKRMRKTVSPYIVQDNALEQAKVKIRKKVVNIPPIDNNSQTNSTEKKPEASSTENSRSMIDQNVYSPQAVTEKSHGTSFADLGYLRDEENSNDSIAGRSVLSDTPTHPELMTNPMSLIYNNIDRHTKETYTYVVQGEFTIPGTDIKVAYKPEDIFHLATKQNLKHLDSAQKKKLLEHQFKIDYRHCLTPMDEDGNLPIHLAVINNDLELLSRQCLVLKIRGCSLDIVGPSHGLTALQLAVQAEGAELASTLVRHGASPLRTDATHRTSLHDAAERHADVLRSFAHAAATHARKILLEDEELWKPEMETQTDEELGKYLMKHACSMFDKQGYTPLMLAAMHGLYENVRTLLEHSPSSVNDRMPTSGNTALYLAVAATCNSCIECGNKSIVVDHFRKTIQVLLEFDADPSIDNYSSTTTNVHSLLQELNNAELTKLIANIQLLQTRKKNYANFKNGIDTDISKLMLVKGRDGKIEYKSIQTEKQKKKPAERMPVDKKPAERNAKGNKLVILGNAVLSPGNSDSGSGTKPGNTSSDGTATNIEPAKIFVQKNLKISNTPMIIAKKDFQAVKRKQSDGSIVIKLAKVNE